MLRAHDRPGGIGIYSRNIVKHLLRVDRGHEYVLMYNNADHIGTYNHLPYVTELYVEGKNPLIWDQVSVPRLAKQHNVELLFNTKFSLPLFGRFLKVMKLHGASWFVRPDLYGRLDIMYVKLAMPIYCRIADFLLANSDCTRRDFIRLQGIDETKIRTVNLAFGSEFKPNIEQDAVAEVRHKHQLPERFILTVTSYDPRKNFSTIAAAFKKVLNRAQARGENISLVVAGKDCHKYAADFGLEDIADNINFLGWVEQSDLPALYTQAAACIFPSVYEEFGIPVVEAMACGCPIVSSNTGAIPDLVGEAGLLSDPFDTDSHVENLDKLLSDSDFSKMISQRGLERAKQFSWDTAADETIASFEEIYK